MPCVNATLTARREGQRREAHPCLLTPPRRWPTCPSFARRETARCPAEVLAAAAVHLWVAEPHWLAERSLTLLAQTTPERFAALCAPLGAASVRECEEVLHLTRRVCGGAAVALCALLAPALLAAAKLISVYEVMVGLVRFITAVLVVVGMELVPKELQQRIDTYFITALGKATRVIMFAKGDGMPHVLERWKDCHTHHAKRLPGSAPAGAD